MESEQFLIRKEKLNKLKERGFNYQSAKLVGDNVGSLTIESLVETAGDKRFLFRGRIIQKRQMGKASFFNMMDQAGVLQLYINEELGERYQDFCDLDLGDILEVQGKLFRTKKGQATIHVDDFNLLNKCLHPLPEKWHGLTDIEQRYRYRYLDLLADLEVRELFRTRSKILSTIRHFFEDHGFIEFENPVLESVSGGAVAKPFKTRFNALDQEMYMRIALELPLKKLIVGGYHKVFEVGRVFRNEGLSRKHNPEFTMIEFYQAYATYQDNIKLTESLLKELVTKLLDSTHLDYGGQVIDFSKITEIKMVDSLLEIGKLEISDPYDFEAVKDFVKQCSVKEIALLQHSEGFKDWGALIEELFAVAVEPRLVNPTFVTHQPASISPLAKRSEENPLETDRFELFIAGMEIANGYSELNDPFLQREIFEDQVKGTDKWIDENFLRALEYGLPPTAGEGIGIDRLVMLLTNKDSIREVVMFPQLRDE